MTALEEIQKSRSSEKLASQVAVERSMGRHTLADIASAFKSLNVRSDQDTDDDHIIGCYNSLRLDVSAEQKQRLKESLAIVGEYRDSRRLMELARDGLFSFIFSAPYAHKYQRSSLMKMLCRISALPPPWMTASSPPCTQPRSVFALLPRTRH